MVVVVPLGTPYRSARTSGGGGVGSPDVDPALGRGPWELPGRLQRAWSPAGRSRAGQGV